MSAFAGAIATSGGIREGQSLLRGIQESKLTCTPIEILIDHIEFDEGRDLRSRAGLGKHLGSTQDSPDRPRLIPAFSIYRVSKTDP
jgi:hypothetical protein